MAFATDQDFPFRLLSDVDHSVGVQYEVSRDPGDKFTDFPRRFAYLITPAGVIHRSYDVTDVASHADVVLADIEQAVE